MTEFFRVGHITSTHALKGEVKVISTSSDKKRFETLDKVAKKEIIQFQA